MTTTVEGKDLYDVQQQVFSRHRPSWIEIHPVLSQHINSDWRRPADKFSVTCTDAIPDGGTFTRTLSAKEAISVIAHLLKTQEKVYKKHLAETAASARTALRKEVLAARKAARAAQLKVKELEGR